MKTLCRAATRSSASFHRKELPVGESEVLNTQPHSDNQNQKPFFIDPKPAGHPSLGRFVHEPLLLGRMFRGVRQLEANSTMIVQVCCQQISQEPVASGNRVGHSARSSDLHGVELSMNASSGDWYFEPQRAATGRTVVAWCSFLALSQIWRVNNYCMTGQKP
jgi:hypothetical protein